MPQGAAPGTGQDEWMHGPAPAQNMFPEIGPANPVEAAPAEKIPLEVALNARDGGKINAANPMTAAAAPLLILLGRLRLMIIDMDARPLMEHVARRIVDFEREALEAGCDPTDVAIGKYALCGTADDIVQNLPGTETHVWLQYSMLAQFFQRRTSGVGFYEELTKLLRSPGAHYDLLELMHACLSLGFEGQYRGSPNGANELARVRRDVYQTLRHVKGRSDDDISPHWRGLDLKMRKSGTRVPLWAIACAAAAILVGVYFLLRILLGNSTDGLSDRLIALSPTNQIGLVRQAAFVPAKIPDHKDPSQIDRIRGKLASNIAKGGLTVEGVGDAIDIKVPSALLFGSGSATVPPEFTSVAVDIAKALQTEPGPIHIVGYTDNVPLSGTGRFKNNYDLSVARAQAVEQIMAETITDHSRLTIEGRGELDPVAPNTSDANRQLNRRVEIMIPRQETLTGNAAGDAQVVQASATN
jgi:type VI secretion system protein ImpK